MAHLICRPYESLIFFVFRYKDKNADLFADETDRHRLIKNLHINGLLFFGKSINPVIGAH